MKIKKLFMSLLAILICSISCAQNNNVSELLPPEAFSDFIVGEGIQLIDVRTPEEFAEGHIGKAVNINYNDVNFEEHTSNSLNKTLPVAIYCRSGVRSHNAAAILFKNGFKVYELQGGILSWKGNLIK
ncbi:MAG: rhodanese-like domain-containing protein [Rikenellaceae bacterium]